jgi:hypothetical protein
MNKAQHSKNMGRNKYYIIGVNLIVVLMGFLLSSCALLSTGMEDTEPVEQDNQENEIAMQATIDALALQMTEESLNLQQTQVALQQTQAANDEASSQADVQQEEAPATVQATPEAEDAFTDFETEFTEDFSSNTGRFSTTDGITIENGALYMGEFERCAEFDTDQPVGCISVCETCGELLPEYEVNVETVYVDGITERFYGLVLRFVDENGNHRIDREDYFLGWVFSLNKGVWALWEHKVDDFTPWRMLNNGEGNMRTSPRKPNYLRVVASQNGERIDVYMNDVHMVRVVNTLPIPGETKSEEMPMQGSIGLWVAERGLRVFYDNYEFTDTPSSD